MHKNQTAALVAAMMTAMALVPLGQAVPSGSPDATIAGPASIDIKGVLGAGVGFCQSELPGAPLDCNAAPGTISGAGAYAHDTTSCTGAAGCSYDVWAIQTSGLCVPLTCGWGISVCTDRDNSGVCTNIASNFDDFGDGYKGDEVIGDKEKKHDDWAHVDGFCVRQDLGGAGFDDFWVFITAWLDESFVFINPNDNTGLGVSIGTYDIYVENQTAIATQADCFADEGKGIPFTGDPDPALP